jgi:hypothetical protein
MSPEEAKVLDEVLNVVTKLSDQKPNEWLPVIAAIGGALIGAIASFFPATFLEKHKQERASKRLLASLKVEVAAHLEVFRYRKYHESIIEIIDHLKAQPENTVYDFFVQVPEHYSRIFQENCRDIGLIETKAAEMIVTYHQLIDSVVQDVHPEGVIGKGATLKEYIELEKILSKAINVAKKIVGNI